jgi:hypothetical protein
LILRAAATAALLALASTGTTRADERAAVLAAVDGLYSSLAAGNAPALTAYLPPGGFTEFSPPESTLKTLDLEYFRQVLTAGAKIRLKVEQPQVRLLGTDAILTGYRVGDITLPDGRRLEIRDCMTMLWSRQRGAWLLQHVHISPCSNS